MPERGCLAVANIYSKHPMTQQIRRHRLASGELSPMFWSIHEGIGKGGKSCYTFKIKAVPIFQPRKN